MQINFGKYFGESLEKIVLTDPSYIMWMRSRLEPTREMFRCIQEAAMLIGIFDDKPFVKKCNGKYCNNLATRACAYIGGFPLTYWCEQCDPYSAGAMRGKLLEIRTYDDAVSYATSYLSTRTATPKFIKKFAQAKGLPARIGKRVLESFFNI